MIESKDYLIVQQLKTDFENSFNSINTTKIKEVKIGDFIFEDMVNKPAISINPYGTYVDDGYKVMGNVYYKRVDINLDCFMDYNSEDDDWNDIYIFKEEVENFLKKNQTNRTSFRLGDEQLTYIAPMEHILQARINFSMIYKDVN